MVGSKVFPQFFTRNFGCNPQWLPCPQWQDEPDKPSHFVIALRTDCKPENSRVIFTQIWHRFLTLALAHSEHTLTSSTFSQWLCEDWGLEISLKQATFLQSGTSWDNSDNESQQPAEVLPMEARTPGNLRNSYCTPSPKVPCEIVTQRITNTLTPKNRNPVCISVF